MAETLFGLSPEDIQAQRQAATQAQALRYAQMEPAQQVNYAGYMAGNQLGNALMGMMGAQDPELEKASVINKLVQDTDMNDLDAVKGLIGKLNKAGATREAMALIPRVDTLTKTQEDREWKTEERKAKFEELKYKQEQDAKAKIEAIRVKAEEDAKRAADNNASREQIAQIMAQSRTDVARIMAETRLSVAQLAAALKADKPEKVDDKLGVAISTLEQQAPLIKIAQDMKARIQANPGYLTMSGKLGGLIDAATGTDTPALALQSDLKAFQSKARNAYLLLAKGTQTEGDAQRAWEEFAPTLDWSTPQGALRSVSRIEDELTRQVNATKAYVNARSPGRVTTSITPEPEKPASPAPAVKTDGWSIKLKPQ